MQIELVHQVYFLCLKTAIAFACIDLPISVHNDRQLSANGFVTVWPIAIKFVRDSDNVIKIGRISPEWVKFHSKKLTMIFKLNLKKKYVRRL